MTKEEIIDMAREALKQEPREDWNSTAWVFADETLQTFAKLVAKHTLLNTDPNSFMSFQEGVEAGRFAEREACAKVCDDMEEKAEGTECCKWPTPIDCAEAIRARGQA